MTVEIICADARGALAAMPAGSVHACVTSPPYWSLRDYGLEAIVWGGDEGCEHKWGQDLAGDTRDDGFKVWANNARDGKPPPDAPHIARAQGAFCRRCSAWRGSLGLEPTPELYVEHIVQVMREVRRVLRDDGTLWLNLGDSYASSPPGNKTTGWEKWQTSGLAGAREGSRYLDTLDASVGRKASSIAPGLKPKDLVGIPWRVAFALQVDGWWLRSDIVWSKPNPMPESVTDRPTRAHEYLFLLAKSARYYYDADAIREPAEYGRRNGTNWKRPREADPRDSRREEASTVSGAEPSAGRNRRSVWEIATQPYPGAHFAVFPEKLVEPCILAGTSERGCCPECGAPWERVVEKGLEPTRKAAKTFVVDDRDLNADGNDQGSNRQKDGHKPGYIRADVTTGWRPTCDHDTEPVACRVLDPFSGSGTVGLVAERLGRHSVLIDASEDYCRMARERTAQRGLMAEAAQ